MSGAADRGFCEAFTLLFDLVQARMVLPEDGLLSMWALVIDINWTARINGTQRTMDGVPPRHGAIEFQGAPVGLISPRGGTVPPGVESELIAALKAELGKRRW